MHRRHLLALGLAALAAPGHAAARPYRLHGAASAITYSFTLNGAAMQGSIPIDRADLQVDAANLAASTADVTADVRRARTPLIFATEALKSAAVLDAARFPLARFRSTRVILGPGGRISGGAALEGDLTLRGTTRPVRFEAALFRPPGTAPEDLDTLTIRLRGAVNRHAFGASGHAGLVGDRVGIAIDATISAV